MSHVLWVSTLWLLKTQNIPSENWGLSFLLALFQRFFTWHQLFTCLCTNHYPVKTWQKSALHIARDLSFSFSLLCKAILLPRDPSCKYIYFSASVFLKLAVSLQLRKSVRLCLGSPSLQAGSWGYSLGAPHSWLCCQGTLKCLLPNVWILLFHMFIWFCGSLKWDRFLVLGRRCQKLSIYWIFNPSYHRFHIY